MPSHVGPDAPSEASHWSRAEIASLALATLAMLLSLSVLGHGLYDPKNDGAVYIESARSIAAGEGYQYLDAPVSVRPPGFSVLLAPVVELFDADFRALNVYVSLFGIAAMLLLHLHQRRRVPWPLALLTVAAIWLNPAFQRFCNQVMSDVPALSSVLLCLVLERWSRRAPSIQRDAILGVAIGLAGFVRTGSLLLLPAIAVARVVAQMRAENGPPWPRFAARQLAVFVLAAVVVQMPWAIRNQLEPPTAPADQLLPYSYATGLLHSDKSDPNSPRLSTGEILGRIPDQGHQMIIGLGSRLLESRGRWTYALLAAPFILGFLATLFRRRASAEWFTLGVLALLALYFGYQNRLLLPAYVFMLCATVESLRVLGDRIGGPRVGIALPAAALVALIVVDFDPHWRRSEIERLDRRWERAAEAVERGVPAQHCLAASWGFHYSLLLQRPVYSLTPTTERLGQASAAEEVIERYGIDTVLLSEKRTADQALLPYFQDAYGPPRRLGPVLAFRVREVPACEAR